MMRLLCLLSFIIILPSGCQQKSSIKNKGTNLKAQDSTTKHINDSLPQPGIDVSAFLIYNDGTLSTFDVVNNKTIALWNTVAGGGDALKPSEKIKISVTGKLDSLNIRVKNGHQFAMHTNIIAGRHVDFIIKNTGCRQVYISILKNARMIYNDSFPFQCGE
jgi:hypothetical protein